MIKRDHQVRYHFRRVLIAILLIIPFVEIQTQLAHPFEPRVGCMVEMTTKKLRLDIGTSVELLKPSNNISVGSDFFTFTRLRSEGRLKFPVETIDYQFGLYSEFRDTLDRDIRFLRFRLSHISAHLADGYSANSTFLKTPFVFSREFCEVVGGKVFGFEKSLTAKPYLGVTYIWSTAPRNVSRIVPMAGFDARTLVGDWLICQAGYNFRLIGVDEKFAGTHSAQIDLEFPSLTENISPNKATESARALKISLYYYHGRSMHGLFYRDKDSYVGLGFTMNGKMF